MTKDISKTAPKDSAPNTKLSEAEYNANVPIDLIEPDPKNRDKMDKAHVTAMAESIKAVGLLQPIVLRMQASGKYRLIAGEHRWRAYQELKRPTIAARIYRDESDLAAAKKKAVENAQRVDLTPIERAKRFKELQELGAGQKEIGLLFGGLSQPVVANGLRLLELPTDVQEMISAKDLSEAHGVSLVRFAKWPRVCSRIAEMARDHGYSSKSLNEEGIPFANECIGRGLIEKIQIKDRYYSDGAIYKLPRQFGSHRDFLVNEYYAYYFVPEDPKDNVWAAEKKLQDAARAKADVDKRAREAKALAKNGGKSNDAIERAKVREKNKAIRASNLAALNKAFEKLKQTPEPTALLVSILVDRAIGGAFGVKRICEAAELVEVEIPNGVISPSGGYGMHNIKVMAGMSVIELSRLAVAVILGKDIDDANKNAWETPKSVDLVINSKVPPTNLGVGDLVAYDTPGDTGGDCVVQGIVLSVEQYEKQAGVEWSKGWTGNSLPLRITKDPRSSRSPITVVVLTALRLVKSAAPSERKNGKKSSLRKIVKKKRGKSKR